MKLRIISSTLLNFLFLALHKLNFPIMLVFLFICLCAEETPALDPSAATVQSSDAAVPPPPRSAAPPNSRSQAGRTGKENVRLPAGGDPYEPFSRTERSHRDQRRPDWNTHRSKDPFRPRRQPQQKHKQEHV